MKSIHVDEFSKMEHICVTNTQIKKTEHYPFPVTTPLKGKLASDS